MSTNTTQKQQPDFRAYAVERSLYRAGYVALPAYCKNAILGRYIAPCGVSSKVVKRDH